MIGKSKYILLIILWLLPGAEASSQTGKYIINNYNLMEELSLNGSIWSAVQDTNGTMFFGCDYGVVAYDGNFWMDVSRKSGTIRSLYKSNSNRVYYGSMNDFGRIDHDVLQGYHLNSLSGLLPDSVKNFGEIWSIAEHEGKIFFQSSTRIFVMNGGDFQVYPVDDSYHRAFVAHGKYYVNQKGTGLTVFAGGGFEPVDGGQVFSDKTISVAIPQPGGGVLICTRNHGIFRFHPESGLAEEAFTEAPETISYLTDNNLYHALMLPNGQLAFSTLYGGTIVTDRDGKMVNMLNRRHGLQDNVHYYLYFTGDLNLWMCTSNGISTWAINSPFIYWDYTSGIDGIVLDIQKYRDRIFVGSLTGLYAINSDFSTVPGRGNQVAHLLDTEVWSLLPVNFGKNEILLLGTGRGLYTLHNETISRVHPGGIVLKMLRLKNHPEIILSFKNASPSFSSWVKGSPPYKELTTSLWLEYSEFVTLIILLVVVSYQYFLPEDVLNTV